MIEHDVSAYGQAETGAAQIAAAILLDAVETFKDPLLMMFRYTGSVVAHTEGHGVAFRVAIHGDGPAFRAVADRVFEQIPKDPDKLVEVSRNISPSSGMRFARLNLPGLS